MIREIAPSEAPIPMATDQHRDADRRRELLSGLNVYGLDLIGDVLLAGLLLADPILLIGAPGCAKTLLARAIAFALRLIFHAYDASKALFEDMIGFPSPKSLADGKLQYVPTPLTLFDKELILIDEISRASPATAGKWLEVIRSRKVAGLPLPMLKQILAAMNPSGDAGTHPLDWPTADRFAFILQMTEAKDMPEADLRQVIGSLSEDDAPGLRHAPPSCNGVDLATFLASARKRYDQLDAQIRPQLTGYVVRLVRLLTSTRVEISGRRAGMLYRNIVAVLAVRGRDAAPLADLEDDIAYALCHSMPQPAMGVELRASTLQAVHYEAIHGDEGFAPSWWHDDPIELCRRYMAASTNLHSCDHHEVIGALEQKLTSGSSPATVARAHVALLRILLAIQSGQVKIPSDAQMRAARAYDKVVRVSSPWSESAVAAVAESRLGGTRVVRRIESVALALCLNVYFEGGKRVGINAASSTEVENIYQAIYRELTVLLEERS